MIKDNPFVKNGVIGGTALHVLIHAGEVRGTICVTYLLLPLKLVD